jgi:D-aspartate ligase
MGNLIDLDTSVPALVLKLGRYPVHHGALGIARSLGRRGVPVYAIVEDLLTPLALSRYLTDAYMWRTQPASHESVLADLAVVGDKIGRPAILVPTDDLAAVFVAENQKMLSEWFLMPRPPRELPRKLANKKDLYRLCRAEGVPCPATQFPVSLHDVQAFLDRAVFPVMVKAAESHRRPNGVPNAAIVQTADELLALYRKMENPLNPNVILQEYIPQSCAEDWIYHGYRNPLTGCMIGFTGRKLRSWPPFAGPTTLGISEHNSSLISQTERLLRRVEYAGILDLDYRLDLRDGQYKLVDFNPRIGANFRMFEDTGGIDVVRAMHLDLTGRAVRRGPDRPQRTFIVESYDALAAASYMRQGCLTPGKWWNSIKDAREFAWFSWRDPLPFAAMCARMVADNSAKQFRREWDRLKRLTRLSDPFHSGRPYAPVRTLEPEPDLHLRKTGT